MTSAKLLKSETINQDTAREYDPSIQDTLLLTFEVKISFEKDDIESIFNMDSFEIGDSDARVSNLFRNLYMKHYGIGYYQSY